MGDRVRFLKLTWVAEGLSATGLLLFHKWNGHGPVNVHEIAASGSLQLQTISKFLCHHDELVLGSPVRDWCPKVLHEQLAYNVVIIVPNLRRNRPTIMH